MNSVDSTAVRNRMHGLWLASTALVGIRILPQPVEGVLHAAPSRLRMARLLALAVEPAASLLDRLGALLPKRASKVRPAARIGRRRRWRTMTLAAASALLLGQASGAGAQTWVGGTSDYDTAANWTPATVPQGTGATAVFGAGGVTTTNITTDHQLDGIRFDSGSPTRIINIDSIYALRSSGIVNNSGVIQNVIISGSGVNSLQLQGAAGLSNISATITAGSNFIQFLGTGSAATSSVEVNGLLSLQSISGSVAIGSLTGSGVINSDAPGTPNQVLEVGALNTSTTFSGSSQERNGTTLSLNKVGSGALVLTGALSYTGTTTVSGGTLQIGGTVGGTGGGATGSLNAASNVTVLGGTTLALARTGLLNFGNAVSGAGALTVRGATGAGDRTTVSGALTQTGGLTVTDASNVTLSGSYNASVAGDGLVLNGGTFTNQGTIAIDGASFSNAVLTSATTATAVVNTANSRIVGRGSGVIQIAASNAPGALTVDNSGLIQGQNYNGVTQHGSGALTVTNSGVIYGQNNIGGTLTHGVGSDGGGVLGLTNAAGGRIVGRTGVKGSNAADTITNAGTIAAGSYDTGTGQITVGGADGISLAAGGQVTNQAGGVIQGGFAGITAVAGTLQVGNVGTITGGTDAGIRGSVASLTNTGTVGGFWGVFLTSGAAGLTNTAVRDGNGTLTGGIITGSQDGIHVQSGAGALTLINSGRIAATLAAGVFINSNAAHSITNSGALNGGNDGSIGYGVNHAVGTLTLTNQSGGTIDTASGGAGAILLNSTGAANVTLDSGSFVTGQIVSRNSGGRTLTVNGALNGNYNGGSGTGAVTFTLGATGTMQGATFGIGNDTFTYQGGTVGGTVDAGFGTNVLISALGTNGTGTLNQANLINFGSYTQQSGALTLTGNRTNGPGWSLAGGSLSFGVDALNTASLITGNVVVRPTAGTTLNVRAGSLLRATGSVAIENANGAFTINNAGTIDGTSGNTIQNGNTTLTLNNTGTITTTNYVTVLAGANSQITNSGTITGGSDTTYGRGIEITGTGGQITNQSGGVIQSAAANPVIFDNGGTLTNQFGGTIRHTGTANDTGGAGVYSNGALTLTNSGVITTASTGPSDGVTVQGVGTITNIGTRDGNGSLTGGLIRAASASGLALVGAGSSVTNSGVIQGGTSTQFGYGVAFNGGTITNQAGGFIAGTLGGVSSSGASATITNGGTIGTGSVGGTGAYARSGAGTAILLANGGTITNGSTAFTAGQNAASVIDGGTAINATGGTLRLDNSGVVTGLIRTGSGVGLAIVNRAGATISSADSDLMYPTDSVISIVNAGTIRAGKGVNTGLSATGVQGTGTGTITNAGTGILLGGSNPAYSGQFDNAVQFAGASLTFNNYGSATSDFGANAFNGAVGGAATINLFAGSTIGSIQTGGSADTLSLYTGTGTNNAGVTYDTTTGTSSAGTLSDATHVRLQSAGTLAAASTGTINLGGGSNTLNLRGTGDGTAANGAAGALNLSNVSNVATLNKQDTGTFVLTGGYNGALTTNVTGGRVIAQNTGSAFGSSGTVAIGSGATVELNNTTGTSVLQAGNTFNGAGTIAKTGTGRFDLGGLGTVTIALAANGLIDVREGRLAGSNNFQGVWTDNKGSLNIESGATFDGVEGTVIVDRLTGAGTLQGGFQGTRTTTIGIADGTATFSGTIQNGDNPSNPAPQLALTKTGSGTQTLSGTSTYSGATTISGGTLRGGATNSFSANSAFTVNGGTTLDLGGFGNTVGSLAGAGTVTNSGSTAATLTTGGLGQSPTFSGLIQNGANPAAPTGLTKTGAGTLTLTGANTYTGATTVSGGTLQINDGGRIGQNAGGTVFSTVATTGGTLAINRSDAYTYGGLVTGSGNLNQIGTGTLTLTGANGVGTQFTGTANVTAGTLSINGTLGDTAGRSATVNVNTAGTLHGTGTIAGSVVVGNGGTVSAGNSPGTLTVAGNYTLNAGSTSLFEMGTAGQVGGPNGAATSNDLINVGGTLTLGGALRLVDTASPANPLVSGYYRLFNYNQNGTGPVAAGDFASISVASGSTAEVYKSVPNQVNVLVTNGAQSVQFWDGADTTGATPGAQGGTGTWSTANTNWTTNPSGQINDSWRSGVGIFTGTAGTVTVAGTQDVQGLQFVTTGYTLTGGALNLSGNPSSADTNSFITVDAGVATTIASSVVGSGAVGLTKRGAGTLTLTGNNGYSGGTVLAAGTLNAGSANALGTAGTLSFTGGTLQYSTANAADYSARFSTAANQAYRIDTNGRDVTYATGLASAGGSLTKLGAGTLTLTGASTYTGATTISSGTLQVGSGGTTGSIGGGDVAVAGGTTLALNRSGQLAFASNVSGAGALTVRGATGATDLITLSGALTQTGGFTVADASNVTLSGSYSAANSIVLSGGGRFTNQGSVTASNDAILTSPSANTTVVNAAGAEIVGGFSGIIQVQNGAPGTLTVTNSGLIRGIGYDGVTQHGTGALTVTNNGTGVIEGRNGTNSSNGYGVGSDDGGVLTLTNATGGTIVGQSGVVGSNAGDRVTNAGRIAAGILNADGSITQGGIAGVQLRAGGTVVNQAGGRIEGGQGAVVTQNGETLRVDNAGTIANGTGVGIQALGNGNALRVVNRTGGSVTGSSGIYAGNGAGQGNTIDLVNAGTIAATNGVGVGGAGGSGLFRITNANGATIRGGGTSAFAQGIQINAAAGSTVDNYGTIAAGAGTPNAINSQDNAYTVNLYAGSTVTGGITLGGGNDTVALYTGTGTGNTTAVTVADPVNGGTVTVRAAGTYDAARFGAIDFGGGANALSLRGTGDGSAANGAAGTLDLGTVTNAGTVTKLDSGTWTLTSTATNANATALVVQGGTLALAGGARFTTPGATRFGTTAATFVDTGATLTNAGTLTASGGAAGVSLTDGTFNNTGTLSATGNGVSVAGGGTIANTGAISGATGIDFAGGTSDLTITGNGSITGTNGDGIAIVRNGGTGNFTLGTTAAALGAVSGTADGIGVVTTGAGTIGIVAGGPVNGNRIGIVAFQRGTGTLAIDGAGTVSGRDAFGISAHQSGTAAGTSAGVTVTGTGATTSANGVGIDAVIESANNAGAVQVTRSGAVTAGTTGINAATAGAGAVTVSAGTVTTTNGSGIVATGTSGAVAVTANGAITAGGTGASGVFLTGDNVGNSVTVAAGQTVQGAIGLRVAGTGTTALANDGTIASSLANGNALQVDGGTLVIGDRAGTLTGAIAAVAAGSTVTVNRTAALSLANTITGTGAFNQAGAGTTTLTGTNSAANGQFTGTATITAGTMAVNGVFGDTAGNAATVNVNTGGTLHGTGTVAGSVVVNGGTVSGGNSPGTLSVARDYTLNTGSTSLFEFGAPGVVGGASNDLINVGRNLQLGGTLSLVAATNATTAPVSGAYRIFNYGGTLAGRFDTVTTPSAGSTALVYTNIPSQVNVLLVNGNQSVQYFDGADTTGAAAGGQGGTGPWNGTSTNWTTLPGGQVNDVWRSGVGIFGGSAGTVTVAGAQNLQGLQFTVDGYQLGGAGTLNLTGDSFTTPGQSFVNVDAGAGVTIANALTATGGPIGLRKIGDGSLTLTGASTYTGPTTVAAGTLAIAAGGSLAASVTNAATFSNAGTVGGGLTNTAGTSTNTGTINGGATILAGTFNTNAAGSVVNGALVNAGTVSAQGQINGAVTNAAGATFTVVGSLTGIGRLTNDGALALGGNSLGVGSLAGTTAAASIAGGGTLNAGSDGTSSGYAGTIGGATGLTKAGAGTLTLSGANTYAGATTVSAGTLQAGAANTLSAASAVTIADAGRMDLNTFNQTIASLAGSGRVTLGSATLTTGGSNATTSYAGTISGTGGLVKTGTGGFTLSGMNGYTGPTTVAAGTLALAAGGSLAGSVNNAATFTNAGSVAGSLSNSGAATNTGTLGGGLTNTGTVTASAGRIDGAIANNAGTVTVSGNVASNGPFANAGGATLAVTGTGAYGLAGLLTNAGSLTVASGGSLTAPAGIVNSGTIAVAQGGTITDALANTGSVGNDGTYNADVSNAASGTIANRATGVWTGSLTANAGTVTNAGQWRGDGRNDAGGGVTNTGTWTTATGPFANAGTLVTTGTLTGGVANTGTVQAAGRIAGAVSNGAGASFTLTGPLAGVTAFTNNGTLDLGGTAFTVGSLSGTATAATLRNGTLATNGDNSSTTYAGTIVDGAVATALVKNGSGSLTLTGTNTYTGGTTVNGGTLVASAASLGSGPVSGNSSLIVDQPGDATLGSALNGSGRLTKQGAGTLTYTGTGTLSGPTTVAAGGLVVQGSLAASPVTVANGAILGGTGRVGGLTVQAGASVAPGATTAAGNLGTLGVNGNVLFASRSLYQVDVTAAGASDRIAATGTATLQGGTVQVTAGTGAYAPRTRYTILSAAGGVTGQFAGVSSNFAFLAPFLSYDANDATLTLARNDLQFGAVATTRNQGSVAAAAQAQGVGTRLYDGIAVLSAPQARQAFDALSGEIHSSAVTGQFTTGHLVREAILDRLRFGEGPSFGGIGGQGIGQRFAPGTTLPAAYTADLPGRSTAPVPVPTEFVAPNPVAVWGQGFGSFGSVGGDGNAARLDQQTSGFVLGADTRLDGSWRVGVAGGYTFTTLDVTARQSTGTVESGYGALYAGGSLGAVQVRLGGAYAGSSLSTNRAVIFPGFSDNASARYGGSLGQVFGEVGYRIGSGAGFVEPFVGGAAIRIGRDGFTERGGVAALTARGQDYDIATSTVGLQAQGQIGEVFGSATPIFVRGLVGYRRAYGDVAPSTVFSFGAAGQTFLTAGVPVARDALVAQAGLDWQVTSETTLSLAYTGQVGADRTQIHGVKGGFLYRW